MKLQEQIINKLLDTNRDFYVLNGAPSYFNNSEIFSVKASKQISFEGKSLHVIRENNFQPSRRVVTVLDCYDLSLFHKTSFESKEEEEAEIDRILSIENKTSKITKDPQVQRDEIRRVFEALEEKKYKEKHNKLMLHLDDIFIIALHIGNKLEFIWNRKYDEECVKSSLFELSAKVSDEMFIRRYSIDNPSSVGEHIKNKIETIGVDEYLKSVIDDKEERVEIVEEFLKDGDYDKLIKKVYFWIQDSIEEKMEKTFCIEGVKSLSDFSSGQILNVALDKAQKEIFLSHPWRKSFIESRTKNFQTASRSYAGGMANAARRVHFNSNKVFQKSRAEILEVIKPLAEEHFGDGKPHMEGGIEFYRFYDLCENTIDFSLEELGLVKKDM